MVSSEDQGEICIVHFGIFLQPFYIISLNQPGVAGDDDSLSGAINMIPHHIVAAAASTADNTTPSCASDKVTNHLHIAAAKIYAKRSIVGGRDVESFQAEEIA